MERRARVRGEVGGIGRVNNSKVSIKVFLYLLCRATLEAP